MTQHIILKEEVYTRPPADCRTGSSEPHQILDGFPFSTRIPPLPPPGWRFFLEQFRRVSAEFCLLFRLMWVKKEATGSMPMTSGTTDVD